MLITSLHISWLRTIACSSVKLLSQRSHLHISAAIGTLRSTLIIFQRLSKEVARLVGKLVAALTLMTLMIWKPSDIVVAPVSLCHWDLRYLGHLAVRIFRQGFCRFEKPRRIIIGVYGLLICVCF